MPNWTNEQLKAIEGRKGTLLVSAAAGSGKTTVLVERVIRRLTDEENRCPANELVIVTFTKAAAAQMKDKINLALREKQASTDSRWLRQQQLLLQSAKICTIDSFCGDLVRENFHQLGISADFRVLDERDSAQYEETALREVLDEQYSQGDEDFLLLSDNFSSGGSDFALGEAIKKLALQMSSMPFPSKSLDKLVSYYDSSVPMAESPLLVPVYQTVGDLLDFCIHATMQSIAVAQAHELSYQLLQNTLNGDLLLLSELKKYAVEKDWNALYEGVVNRSFSRFPSAGKKEIDPDIWERVKFIRKKVRDYADKLDDYVFVSEADFNEDRQMLEPVVRKLIECVKLYSENLLKRKMRDNAFTFNDVEHLALNLLVDENGTKTELAESLSEHYAEIMVDEYQDTNELQDMIFSTISKTEKNLFFVGDIKQSIYRFRQAMPEIFLRRRSALPDFDGESYPARLSLSANFRCRKPIARAVNYVFDQIMTEQSGDVVYEPLNPLAPYEEHEDNDVELILREQIETESEADFVAKYVKTLLNSRRKIGIGDKEHTVTPGDICILTRTKKRIPDYAAALEKLGIRSVGTIEGDLNGTAELKLVLSLLRVLDNPLSDIPLAAVMLSPMFGFTTDDLAKIRASSNRKEPLYRSVSSFAKAGNEACRAFSERLNALRRIEIGMGAEEFLRRLFDETDLEAIVCAMGEPQLRLANLRSLLTLANQFDAGTNCGLRAFLRFLDSSDCKGVNFNIAEDCDAVKIMNIHKSKGLEFGVCILCDLGSRSGGMDMDYWKVSKTLGIGLMRREPLSNRPMKTLQYLACSLESDRLDIAEEIRVQYVALTRAKEKLCLIGTVKNAEKTLQEASLACGGTQPIPTFWLQKSATTLGLFLPALMRHKDSLELRLLAGVGERGSVKAADFAMQVSVLRQTQTADLTEGTAAEQRNTCQTDEELKKQMLERMNYVYPYSVLSRVVAKRQASGFADVHFDERFFASSKPAFLQSGGLSAAQKGTLTHKFLQLCDFALPLEEQIAGFVQSGVMTETEAKELKKDEIQAFLHSDLCKRISASPHVVKEKKFAMLMPVTEIYPDLPEWLSEEKVVVQGMVDLAFEEDGKMVVVDYKTDHGVDEAELLKRHSQQLKIYARALSQCTDYEVKQA
ncbi:MAG TPA: helicase-exonuclease AddAB subunit AddA, partial [Ruminococcaceae bacterium]|nr:helicase-exonuclease AddAB subunit AddA [Oscillospiraceae bacterium]